jgi:hypothetical protein
VVGVSAIGGDILKGNTLTLLEERPMYGFQIAKEIGCRSGGLCGFVSGFFILLPPPVREGRTG